MADVKDFTRGAALMEADGAEQQGEGLFLLHNPKILMSLAQQLREEAKRCEARADAITEGRELVACASGCWNVLSTCIQVQPL